MPFLPDHFYHKDTNNAETGKVPPRPFAKPCVSVVNEFPKKRPPRAIALWIQAIGGTNSEGKSHVALSLPKEPLLCLCRYQILQYQSQLPLRLPLIFYQAKEVSKPLWTRGQRLRSLVLQSQIKVKVSEAAAVVALAGSGLMASSPTGPVQRQFRRSSGLPDQPAQQPAHLGHRERYQACIPIPVSPFLPSVPALACCRTTAR